MIEISLVLYNAHIVSKNQDKFIFYDNNYINWDQFNSLYDLNYCIEKGIKNENAVIHKLGPVFIRANNQRLEVAKEKVQKREEMVEKQKTKAIDVKR